MYLKQSINNISNFYLSYKCIYLFTKKDILIKYDDKNIWKKNIDTQHLLFEHKNSVFIYTNYKKIEKLNSLNAKLIKKIEEDIFPIETIEDKLWVETSINNEYRVSSVTLDDFEVVNHTSIGNKRVKKIIHNTFLSKNDTDINCYYLDTGKEVWSFNFQQYTKQINNHLISNELLVINNLLFLSFANSSLNATGSIVINTDTGKVHKEIPSLKGFLYNNNNKEVIATSGIFNNIQTLSIFNLDTEECKTTTLNTIFPTNNWSIKHQSSVVHNNKLYLAIQQGETLIASILAVLDLKTNKIIDYYELLKDPKKISNEDNWYHIDKIKVNDSMIAVLTAGGTLHIFEKEETDLI
ncbi:hypothetical protein AX016_2236 [Cellulophaga sp. RHA19]|nr:hypothetical protein AX016_2236 [Cellulophaga sp. RHA19]